MTRTLSHGLFFLPLRDMRLFPSFGVEMCEESQLSVLSPGVTPYVDAGFRRNYHSRSVILNGAFTVDGPSFQNRICLTVECHGAHTGIV